MSANGEEGQGHSGMVRGIKNIQGMVKRFSFRNKRELFIKEGQEYTGNMVRRIRSVHGIVGGSGAHREWWECQEHIVNDRSVRIISVR